MHIWDAIVVGAGPAGSAAAYDLASSGSQVLLLDKAEFPRPKACAGGLTMKTVRALRFSVEPVTRLVVQQMALEAGDESTFVRSRNPVCAMTVRYELDAFCLKKAIEAGAHFRKIERLMAVEGIEGGVRIGADGESFAARYLIAADGANSQIRRWLVPGASAPRGFAIEAEVPAVGESWNLTFDFGGIRNGYGWIFPKGDHVNVGLGHYFTPDAVKLTRATLIEYVRRKLRNQFDGHVCGQYLAIGDWPAAALNGRVLFAGDAAGLTDPLTAEGIYNAVVSGQAAANSIQAAVGIGANAAAIYESKLGPIKDELRFSTQAAYRFYANPARGVRIAKLPFVGSALVRTYALGTSSGGAMLRLARLATERYSR